MVKSGARNAATQGQNVMERARSRYIEKFQTSAELKELVDVHRYSREDAEKALRVCRNDAEKALAYLKSKQVPQRALEIDFTQDEDDY